MMSVCLPWNVPNSISYVFLVSMRTTSGSEISAFQSFGFTYLKPSAHDGTGEGLGWGSAYKKGECECGV